MMLIEGENDDASESEDATHLDATYCHLSFGTLELVL